MGWAGLVSPKLLQMFKFWCLMLMVEGVGWRWSNDSIWEVGRVGSLEVTRGILSGGGSLKRVDYLSSSFDCSLCLLPHHVIIPSTCHDQPPSGTGLRGCLIMKSNLQIVGCNKSFVWQEALLGYFSLSNGKQTNTQVKF